MIRPLRRAHLVAWAVLALALPVGIGAALWARAPVPRVQQLWELDAPAAGAPVAELPGAWGVLPIRTRLLRSPSSKELALELWPARDLRRPDVLVYGSAEAAPPGASLPDSAYLLGALAGDRPRRFTLPSQLARSGGWLHLYSLGHQERIASARLPATGS